jgi:hypothetical protein
MFNKFYGVSLVALAMVMSAGSAMAADPVVSKTEVTIKAEKGQTASFVNFRRLDERGMIVDFGTFNGVNDVAKLTQTVDLPITGNSIATLSAAVPENETTALFLNGSADDADDLNKAIKYQVLVGDDPVEVTSAGNVLETVALSAESFKQIKIRLNQGDVEAALPGPFSSVLTFTLRSN